MINGVHVEGPSISPADGPRGAHPLSHVRLPSIDEFNRWQDACNCLVSLVTPAPEHSGNIEYIEVLVAQNISVSLGHSDATPTRIRAAVAVGASLSTHLGTALRQ